MRTWGGRKWNDIRERRVYELWKCDHCGYWIAFPMMFHQSDSHTPKMQKLLGAERADRRAFKEVY